MTPDDATRELLEKATPAFDKMQDLLWVEKQALEVGSGYAVLFQCYFAPALTDEDPKTITFIADPDGAHAFGLLTDEELTKIPVTNKENHDHD